MLYVTNRLLPIVTSYSLLFALKIDFNLGKRINQIHKKKNLVSTKNKKVLQFKLE